jgi:phage terminase large subunit
VIERNIDLGYHRRAQFIDFHDRTQRWACMICHRKAGKTVASLMDCIQRALDIPDSRYAYIAPLRNQAKTVAWDYLKEFARPVFAKPPNEQELRVDLYGGGRITLFGADNPDALRGLTFDGVVIDEYADITPSLFPAVVRPALADRKGSAVLIGTVKGRNQLWTQYTRASGDPTWYTQLLKASETGILDEAGLMICASN